MKLSCKMTSSTLKSVVQRSPGLVDTVDQPWDSHVIRCGNPERVVQNVQSHPDNRLAGSSKKESALL